MTAVDKMSKLDALRSIGADQVIDYTERDFTRESECYDLILDIPGNHSIADCRRAVAPSGTYVFIGHERFGGLGARWIGRAMPRFIRLLLVSRFVSQRMSPHTVKTKNPLARLVEPDRSRTDHTADRQDVPALRRTGGHPLSRRGTGRREDCRHRAERREELRQEQRRAGGARVREESAAR